jgi:hypothetical protein
VGLEVNGKGGTRTLDPGIMSSRLTLTLMESWTYNLRESRVFSPALLRFDGHRNLDTMEVVEIFNNGLPYMATVNFSVPDDVKAEFDKTFGGQNKSAVIADLMRKAVADAKLRKRRVDIFRTLTQRRTERPSLSDAQIRMSRNSGRS